VPASAVPRADEREAEAEKEIDSHDGVADQGSPMTEEDKKNRPPAKKNAAALATALRANLRRRKANVQSPREDGRSDGPEPERRPPPSSR